MTFIIPDQQTYTAILSIRHPLVLSSQAITHFRVGGLPLPSTGAALGGVLCGVEYSFKPRS